MMRTKRQVSSVLVVVILGLLKKGASALPEGAHKSLQDFVGTPTPAKVNVAVVSFEKYWKDVDNSLTRRLPWPRTTWIFQKGGLRSYILENNAADRSTVAIVPNLRVDWREIVDAVRRKLKNGFVRWIVTHDNLTFSSSEEPVSVLPSCVVGISPRKHVSRDVPGSNPDGRPLLYDHPLHEERGIFKRTTKKMSLSGKTMKIGCLRSEQFEDYDNCLFFSYLFDMLEAKNVSLVYQFHSSWSRTLDDLYCENSDLAALILPLNEGMLAASTYSEIMHISETFYALESKIQALSPFKTSVPSLLTAAVTAASLTICAGLLIIVGRAPAQERAQSETLFLLAILLGTSTPLPNPNGRARTQKVVFFFWALAMVPLSQYFRCVLTSQVTIGRPASSLDTLEELEAALDAGAVAPCVSTESATLDSLMNSHHPTTLGRKLRASLVKYGDQLVTADLRACLVCATRSDRVCYIHRVPSFAKSVSAHIAAFDENFLTRLASMPLRKSFPLRDAYRAFLQRVREGDLLSSPLCKQEVVCKRSSRTENVSGREMPLFELRGFFASYVLLLSGTVGVLVVELLFAHFCKRVFSLRRRRPWR
ncbi:hypothetical protein HPB49_024878 [Dermacentor silvarum]|uniref:Uncharacterized protein n=1 Tax=Dermacentor silvarum TaxID=543639 RepID=A0ACB8DRH8_DERSI|nr:hypothetical protein HPB49_024878 [Dermacentor silvarum]